MRATPGAAACPTSTTLGRVAQQLDIDHLVFNFTEDFDAAVVAPYVAAHAAGSTPNPCVECNRGVKFARLAERAEVLGFDAVATGHHAWIAVDPDGRRRLQRGADRAKDQSYVVHMLDQAALRRTLFPVGRFARKADLRAMAAELGLRTAAKPDSQDVCFITSTGGRHDFLRRRLPLHPARVVDTAGSLVGELPAIELITVGQRKGLGLPGGGPKRFVVDVDRSRRHGRRRRRVRPAARHHVGHCDDVGRRPRRRRRHRPVQRPR